MSDKESHQADIDKMWKWYLTGEKPVSLGQRVELQMKAQRLLFGLLPHGPRCAVCSSPFSGFGGLAMKVIGRGLSSYSPRLCNACEIAVRKLEGGAEIELSMLFADVRGSTVLAEQMGGTEFHEIIQRFYRAASDVLIGKNAMVNRLMGDQVIGLFVPRFAGPEHARVAVEAAIELLKATGHQDPDGPWVPVGAGVHTGIAFVGAVGSATGVSEIAVLGNEANLTARLSSAAGEGEVLVSVDADRAAERGENGDGFKRLQLKGINEPVSVRSLRVVANP